MSRRLASERSLCMALTPDAIPHLAPPLTSPDPAADASLAEGLAALESYKKKDPAKGWPRFRELSNGRANLLLLLTHSCRALQGGRKRADNETKLLQSHGFESLSGRDPVLAQGTWLEIGRAAGESWS